MAHARFGGAPPRVSAAASRAPDARPRGWCALSFLPTAPWAAGPRQGEERQTKWKHHHWMMVHPISPSASTSTHELTLKRIQRMVEPSYEEAG